MPGYGRTKPKPPTPPTLTTEGCAPHGRRKPQEVRDNFLAKLRETASVTRSAEFAGTAQQTIWDWRKKDPEFARQYDEALAIGYERMEEVCRQRAFDGYQEELHHRGHKTGETITKFSESLAMFLLKGNRPGKFRDRVETINNGASPDSSLSLATDEELEAIIRRGGKL